MNSRIYSMDTRLCSTKNFIVHSRLLLQNAVLVLVQYKSNYPSKPVHNEQPINNSDQTTAGGGQSPRKFSNRDLVNRHKRLLHRLMVDNKCTPINGQCLTSKKEVKRIISAQSFKDRQFKKFIRMGSGRVIISCLIYNTYLGLQDRDLIKTKPPSSNDDLDCEFLNEDEPDCCRRDHVDPEMQMDQRINIAVDISSHSSPKTMRQKIFEKYREPPDEKVEKLKKEFPKPERLFHDVLEPVRDSGIHCYEPLSISSHLNGFYWKAKIQLLWPRRAIITGVHTDKENAIFRAYLAACDQLKNLGLIVTVEDSVRPLNCDNIVNILEQISEFGDSTSLNSRGKGFKIVLEKVKKKLDDSAEDLSYNCVGGKVCCEWRSSKKTTNGCSDWSCSVHVGWPVPFSVRMVALSLPSAQMLALLTAASNLKMMGLLTRSNQTLNLAALQKAVFTDVTKQWKQCITQSSMDANLIQPSGMDDVDARIYVDASNVGYGAYLKLADSEKVSWLWESWLEQPHLFSKVYFQLNHKFQMHSTLAELFALVSTVFSWKRKLQHCRLLCYNDNQSMVTLISTVNMFTVPSSANQSLSAYDFLMTTLHDTCQTYNIELEAAWIQRQHNWLADRLANGDVKEFKAAVPNAAISKTRVKHFQWKDVAPDVNKPCVTVTDAVKEEHTSPFELYRH